MNDAGPILKGDGNHDRFADDDNHDCFADDDLVITGISGRFPMADNMDELKQNLYSKRDCVIRAEERWSSSLPGSPTNHLAIIKSVDKFDTEFFNQNMSTANRDDPQHRLLHEVSHEAIIDSGYDPKELSGQCIGVFVGMSDGDAVAVERCSDIGNVGTKYAVGLVACMVANKLTYRYDFTGPSFAVDAACASAGVALEDAFRRLKDGSIDAAVVGGSSLSLDPRKSQAFLDNGLLSPTGECCPFDAKANGFVRGEAIATIFIQKKKDARRIYAKIHNVECIAAQLGLNEHFALSLKSRSDLYRKTYDAIDMDPSVVDYIEAHGNGIPTYDEIEVNSIDEVFCNGRKTPLLLGAMKSSTGHTEAVSALCSTAKVILAFETGAIAPNIRYATPNPKCPGLTDGRIQVVTDTIPYDKPMAAINSFGWGGAMVHMILERNGIQRNQDNHEKVCKIPKLVVYAATTEKALSDMFDHLHQNPMSREFFALLNKSAYIPTLSASYRGFAIIKKDSQPVTSIQLCPPIERKVWYVVTGMGCQWPGMGLDLMQLDVFAQSMRKSAKVLEPFGIDLLELLKPNKNYLLQDRHITPAFVTIAAIQIALVDVLSALGLEPDGIVGHSTGELVCSYADGCCTAEQTILSAYYRGASVESTKLPPGAMAAVGLTWEEAKRRCPEGVFPACHNAEDSVTISGSRDTVETFVEQLKSENIFARIVNAYGYAFHCETVSAVSETLRKALQKIYTNPKPRSKRWLSTSYCEHEWNEPGCQIADANYFCHNLESQVHFREALTHIPDDAITIEIGPHFLLQSILKRAIGNKASYIGLMKRNCNNLDFLLSSIGNLYNLGLDPRVENLYDPVSYPVPRGTPMISPLIQWNHSHSFRVPKYFVSTVGKCKVVAKTSSTDSFLLDHCIEGRSLYPATGYMYLAWKALSATLNKDMDAVPFCIENFKIMRATILSSTDDKNFEVSLLNKSGEFEIVEGSSVAASGKISVLRRPMDEDNDHHYEKDESAITIDGPQMYNELKIHGYEYGPAFQGLLEVNIEGTDGLVKWNSEWISFLDSLLLFFGIIYNNNEFKLPTGALSIKIDPRVHMKFVAGMEAKGLKGIPVKYDSLAEKCTTPGVEIRKLKLEPATHRSLAEIAPVLEEYGFIPYYEKSVLGTEDTTNCESYIRVCCQVANKIIGHLNMSTKVQHILQDTEFSKNNELQEYFASTEDNYLLLMTLKNILEMAHSPKLISKIEAKCQSISDILAEDMLFKVMLSERSLRSLVDVTAENCFGKMLITEWCDKSPILLTAVQQMISPTQTKASYTLIHSQTTTVDSEDLSKRNISVEREANSNAIPANFSDSSHLVVSCFILGSLDSLDSRVRKVATLTKEGGFVLFLHKHKLSPPESVLRILSKLPLDTQSETEIEKLFPAVNLVIISKKSSPLGLNAYLLRKIPAKVQPSQVHLVKVVDAEYASWVEDLKKAMVIAQQRDSAATIYLIAQDTAVNGIIGLVNCLKHEPSGDKIRCVFTDSTAPPFDLNENFYADVLNKDLLMNVYMNGCWGSFRHNTLVTTPPKELTDYAYVECTKLGDLSSFQWQESPLKHIQSDESDQEMYHVYYSSLNFKDVMIATGKLSTSSFKESGHRTDAFVLGMEFSGLDKNGRRIMAMTLGGSICNTFIGTPLQVYDVPDHWTLEEAATVPVVYVTCYYGLIMRGDLQQGEKILIHSGTGGIGQAAIRIALSLGCEIFTTVGTPEKRNFLLQTFPQVKPENIGSSRNTSFEEMVMRRTNGEGVDVVLNSLAEDKFQASVRCLAEHGRFLEIGKYDLQLNSSLGLQIFQKGVSFYGIQMDTYSKRTKKTLPVFKQFEELLYDGIRRGVVQPLNTTVFSIDDTEKAFRYMGSGKHIGKVLLKVREEPASKTALPSPMPVKAYRTLWLSSKKSYIIIGGLGGFGIELAKWLVQKRAGSVVLTSRYGARNPYHHLCLKRWAEAGARVVVSTLNVAKREEAKKLLEETSATYGPIGGIFNSAVVLQDAFIEKQSASDFEEVCAPKAVATKYLDELTRTMCPELDMFVCFSSISCGKGNAGQTNYGYANSVMERICEQRKKDGLHGLAVQWGIIGDVGLVHRHMGDDAMIAGVMAQKIKCCLQCLEKFLLLDKPVVSSFVTADKSRVKKRSDDVLGQISKVFGIPDIDQMNPYRTFGEMGIDSMVGVEVKQLLESSFDTQFSLQEIQDMKIADVKKLVTERDSNKDSTVPQKKEIKNINFNVPRLLLPTETVIALNTDKKGTPLFVIHGNDLFSLKLQRLWDGISRPVFTLQSTKDTILNSLKDMSMWYLKQIQNAFPHTSVHLASVSTAANLALEMALQSEILKSHQPEIKSLTILDGCMDLMEVHTATEQEKQKKVSLYEASDLVSFVSAFSDSDLTELKAQLELLPTLESRMNMISNLLPSTDKSDFLKAAEFHTKKQNVIRFQTTQGKLQKDLTAIEAAEKVLPNDVSAVKSFMSQICNGRITVHRIVGNCEFLVGSPSTTEVAKLLNEFLD